MNNEISVLAQFLESLGPEVSGHSSVPLTDDQMEQIRQFADGQLDADAREALTLLPGHVLEDLARGLAIPLRQVVRGQLRLRSARGLRPSGGRPEC